MTDETNAAAVEAAPVVSAPNLDGDSFTPEQAFEAYQKRNSPAASADPATAGTESPAQGDSDPETAPAETPKAEPEENLPPIEPPGSWTKAEKERFASLPRETQEYLHTREQERDREFRRGQNELAEQRKAIQAERETAEKARQHYETQLPTLMRELESAYQREFSDIKTMDDVVKLQAEDPFRFQAWQVQQMRLQAAKVENDKVEAQKEQAKLSKRATYEAEQNKKLIELVPDMADPEKAAELRKRAVSMLVDDLEIKNDQLSRWYADETGHEILSNAGIQKLIADGLKYREIKAAPAKAIPAVVPSVQKPGVARAPGAASADAIAATRNKLAASGSMDDAYALYQARKARGR